MPVIVPPNVTASDRLNASVALLTTPPASDPVVPPDPICSVPAEIVVPPVWPTAPVRVNVPVPTLVRLPVPEMGPANVVDVLSDPTVRAAAPRVTAPPVVPPPVSEPMDAAKLFRSTVAPAMSAMVTAVPPGRPPAAPTRSVPALTAVGPP